MPILIMALIGIAAGFAIDVIVAKLAREPYERGELDEVDEDDEPRRSGQSLELHSETGSLAMPDLLTTQSAYRRIAIVTVTALLFALVGLQYQAEPAYMAITAAYVAVLIICTSTDVLAYRVPNVVTYPAILGALAVGLLAARCELAQRRRRRPHLRRAALRAVAAHRRRHGYGRREARVLRRLRARPDARSSPRCW